MAKDNFVLQFALLVFGIKAKPAERSAVDAGQFALLVFGIKAKHGREIQAPCREFALLVFGIKAKRGKPPSASVFSLRSEQSGGNLTSVSLDLICVRLYKLEGLWCFDYPELGISQEAFVAGFDHIIDTLATEDVHGIERPLLIFSADAFVACNDLFHVGPEQHGDGVWHRYLCPRLGVDGLLCPTLLSFFPEPPRVLHARLADWPHVKAPAFRLRAA